MFGLAWLGFARQAGIMPVLAQEDVAPRATVPPGTVPPLLKASITFIHVAPFDSDVQATAVDVCTETGEVVDELSGLNYGQSATSTFDPDLFDWEVAPAGANCLNPLADIAAFGLAYGGQAVLVFSGDGAKQPLEVFQVTLLPGGPNLFLPLIGNSNGTILSAP